MLGGIRRKTKASEKVFANVWLNQKITSSFRKWSRKCQILICFTKRELKSNFVVLFLVFFATKNGRRRNLFIHLECQKQTRMLYFVWIEKTMLRRRRRHQVWRHKVFPSLLKKIVTSVTESIPAIYMAMLWCCWYQQSLNKNKTLYRIRLNKHYVSKME